MILGRIIFIILTLSNNKGLNGMMDTLKRSSLKRETGHCCLIQNLRILKESLTHIGLVLMRSRKYLVMDLFELRQKMVKTLPSL